MAVAVAGAWVPPHPAFGHPLPRGEGKSGLPSLRERAGVRDRGIEAAMSSRRKPIDPRMLELPRQLRKDATIPERFLWGLLRNGKLAGLNSSSAATDRPVRGRLLLSRRRTHRRAPDGIESPRTVPTPMLSGHDTWKAWGYEYYASATMTS